MSEPVAVPEAETDPTDIARILVVDDEPEMLESIVRLLLARRLAAHRVAGGREALQLLQHCAYDVILLDLCMPGLNGVQTLEEILRIDPGVSVIVISSLGTECTKEACARAGAYRFLAKPFGADKLETTVRAAIRRSRELRESGAPAAGGRGTILIADDHADFRQALARRLTLAGYQVRAVGTGAEAVAARAERAWDLILMDLHMPGLTGGEAAAAIRGIDPDSPIVFLTGEATSAEQKAAVEGYAAMILAKPLPLARLPQTVEVLIERCRSTRARMQVLREYDRRSRWGKLRVRCRERLHRLRRRVDQRAFALLVLVSIIGPLPLLYLVDRMQRAEFERRHADQVAAPERDATGERRAADLLRQLAQAYAQR